MGPTYRLLGASWIDGPTFRIAVISYDENALPIIGNDREVSRVFTSLYKRTTCCRYRL